MDINDFLSGLFRKNEGGDDEGAEEDEAKELTSAMNPAVRELFQSLLSNRNARVEADEKELGHEGMQEKNNPGGIICGVVDHATVSFLLSPLGTLAVLTDRFGSSINPVKGKPGRFLHQLGHLMFDLGRQWEREQMEAPGEWQKVEDEGEETEIPSAFKDFFASANNEGPGEDPK